MTEVNNPIFWEDVYQHGHTGWELGEPTPVFKRLLDQGRFVPGKLIVLGAGRGHDAREFARHGFDVTAADFALDAVRAMHELSDAAAPLSILHADMFALPHVLDGTFDYVLEYMCYCAIDPSRRTEYADLVTRLLKPGGTLIDLAYPLNPHEGGPPFYVSTVELFDLFRSRGFILIQHEHPRDSVERRRGREELLVFQKQTASS